MKPLTYKRKLTKPAGACSNAYCRRKPAPGMKTCAQCRAYLNRYAREHYVSRTVRPRP